MENQTSISQRFNSLITALGKNPNSFAKSIGKTYTAIDSILKGRSKPGYDLLESIISTYPDVNPNWLLTGEGEMLTLTSKSEDKGAFGSEVIERIVDEFAKLREQLSVKDRQLEAADKLAQGLQRTIDALISRPASPSNFLKPVSHTGKVIELYPRFQAKQG